MELKLDTRGLNRIRTRAPRAAASALNRAMSSGRTVLVREVSKDIGLKQATVRAAITYTQATETRLIARLAARIKRIPLIEFGAKGPEPSRGRGRGVSYRIGSARRRIASGFIATMRSGHRGVFVRSGKRNLPIAERFGPSIGHVFMKYIPAAKRRAADQLVERLRHEFSRLVR